MKLSVVSVKQVGMDCVEITSSEGPVFFVRTSYLQSVSPHALGEGAVFDEPEAGIDLWSFQNLIKVFENMRQTIKGTIIVISHQERILNIADEIVVIENGKVKRQGPKDEILPELLGTSAAANIACEKLGGDR